jgi:hypothetical protein
MPAAHLRNSARKFVKHLGKEGLDGDQYIDCVLRLYQRNRYLAKDERIGLERLHNAVPKLDRARRDQEYFNVEAAQRRSRPMRSIGLPLIPVEIWWSIMDLEQDLCNDIVIRRETGGRI